MFNNGEVLSSECNIINSLDNYRKINNVTPELNVGEREGALSKRQVSKSDKLCFI